MENQHAGTIAISDEVASFAAREHGLFIDGGWRDGQSPARLDVFNPSMPAPRMSMRLSRAPRVRSSAVSGATCGRRIANASC
jgi:hypothetical protein